MTINADGTQSEEVDTLPIEQASIAPLQGEDARVVVPEVVVPAAPAKVEEVEAPPTDPRAARMEALAEKTRENATAELATEQETLIPPAEREAAAAAAAAPAEQMVKLKVRGEIVELPMSEVIARAQKTDAADTYLSEARQILEDTKKAAREPAPAAAAAPAAEVAPKVDRLAKAIESIQLGEDADGVRALLDEEINDRAAEAARKVNAEDRDRTRSGNFDADEGAGFAAFQKDHPEVAKDPIAANVIMSVTRAMEGEVIAKFLTDAPPAIRDSFAAANITADGVRAYKPDDVHALFKDMHLKGYNLHRPSAIIKAAGDTVAARFGATTKVADPAPAPAPAAALDRTGRKQQIQQPTVAAIPAVTTGTPAPKNEAERANQSRAELRAERRAGQKRA